MPSIHVSDWVMKEIEKRQGEDESPTDVIRRAFEQEREFYEEIIEEKLRELQGY